MKARSKKALCAAAISSLFAGSAYATAIQSNASTVSIPAGTGSAFQTGPLLGSSTQQVNFEILSPANEVKIGFSWNDGVVLSGAKLYKSDGPGAWNAGDLVPASFTFFNPLFNLASTGWVSATSGYYVLQIDVSSAVGIDKRINGNIDTRDVPAPAVLPLLGIGLLGLGMARRKVH